MKPLLPFLVVLTARATVYPAARGFGDWESTSAILDPALKIFFRLALKPKDLAVLESTLARISTPGSDKFRNSLTKSELSDLIRPKPEAS
jgi:hypothetical protein